MLLSGLIHGHSVALQVLALERVYVTLGMVTASVWWPITCPEDDLYPGPVPGFRRAIALLRELGVLVDRDPEEIECVLDGVKGTWFMWPRPEALKPADLPGGAAYDAVWHGCPTEGYSMRATPVDNDGVTLPTHECYVAFITEDAREEALTH